ncbi:MAG: hypothetical protein AB1772_03400 [Candidatus Zixiibacteriota bacterium]
MARKILIAEQADTTRTVAETVLRQSGYDVIAVIAAQKAREVLELSRPDLIIMGADLMAPDGTPYYERVRQDCQDRLVPVLLFEPADRTGFAPSSDHVVIPRPFDPQDLLNKVTAALSRGDEAAVGGPLAGTEIDDSFLDAALGLDDIAVTSSEVLDKTSLGARGQAASAEKLIGLDGQSDQAGETGGTRVESLVLDTNSSRIVRQVPGRKAPMDGTGKLEILSDQYGLKEPLPSGQEERAVHDYDWFIDSMRKDADPAVALTPNPVDSGKLKLSDHAAAIDPRTPGPGTHRAATPSPAGVEKFIDEFKKEMRQLHETESESLVPDVRTIGPDRVAEPVGWEEKLETLAPTELDQFTREFARELGRRVAEIIAAKIDSEKLMRLVKAEIVQRHRKSK